MEKKCIKKLVIILIFGILAIATYLFVKDSSETGVVEYINAEYGIKFEYSKRYFLLEKSVGTPDRPQLAVVMVEDTEENRNVLEGKNTVPREGPISINVDVYQNPQNLSEEEWIKNDTNWNLSNKVVEKINIGGEEGRLFYWDGLYVGKSSVITRDGLAYVFSVTRMQPEDTIVSQYEEILSSVVFTK